MISIFHNCQLLTPDYQNPTAGENNTLVVKDGFIEYVGTADQNPYAATKEATMHDMRGQILAPAFFDGHMHLLQYGSSLLKINLESCKNLEDIRGAIKAGAAKDAHAPRLFCRGFMPSMLSTPPTAAMLDDLDPRPVFINARDLHSCWCNTAALRELDIQDAPDPEGGIIRRDEIGNPTGYLSETAAIAMVWPYENKVTSSEERLKQSRAALSAYSEHGYTSLIELATDEDIWSCALAMRQEGAPIRMARHWLITPSTDLSECISQVDRAIELHQKYNLDTSADCRIAGIKIILDGTVDACTAAISRQYSPSGVYCRPMWSDRHLRKVVSHADAAGLQCALHAIGDMAVQLAIDVLETCGTPGNRHRIEHLELTSPRDAQRLRRMGITASIQPVHADPALLRKWPELLGDDLCARAFAYAEFHHSGAALSIGTDAPTAPIHPLRNIYVATTRQSAREPDNNELTPVNAKFALPLSVALETSTLGTAKSCFAEQRVGTLEVGKLADFVVLSMQWDGQRLLEGRVLQTWFAGRKVFQLDD